MPNPEDIPGQTREMLQRLYLAIWLGVSRCPPGGVEGSGRGEECLDLPPQAVDPVTQTWTQISSRKRNKTKRGQENMLHNIFALHQMMLC